MKTMILAVTAAGLMLTQAPNAEARGGWGIAAGVLGGVAIGTAISAAAHPSYYYAPAPGCYYYPPVYSAPVVTAAPVYAPAAVYAPAPVYAAPAPVYYSSPAVVVGFGYGRPVYRGYYRGRW